MPTITAYPASVSSADKFTTAQLANVVGNTTAYAVHNNALTVSTPLGGEFTFDLSALPANAVISNIRASVIARANAASRRAFSVAGVHANGPPWPGYTSLDAALPLTTADATYSIDMPWSVLANAGHTVATLKDAGTTWLASFKSTNSGGVSTSWQKFWLTVDYTLPAGIPNPLFINELF